jgi:hypothetical protein
MMTPIGEWVKCMMTRDIIWREDDRVERCCAHGIGHPIGHLVQWEAWMSMHGCDGCCDAKGWEEGYESVDKKHV